MASLRMCSARRLVERRVERERERERRLVDEWVSLVELFRDSDAVILNSSPIGATEDEEAICVWNAVFKSFMFTNFMSNKICFNVRAKLFCYQFQCIIWHSKRCNHQGKIVTLYRATKSAICHFSFFTSLYNMKPSWLTHLYTLYVAGLLFLHTDIHFKNINSFVFYHLFLFRVVGERAPIRAIIGWTQVKNLSH